jgi:hypothetical protein
MPFLNWNLKSDAYLREFVADANGNGLAGGTVAVVITRPVDSTAIASGNYADQGGGFYRFALDPAWSVAFGDLLKAEVTSTAAGKQAYSELWIFVRIDND